MRSIRPKYVVIDRDRHGKTRLYFRRVGQAKVLLSAPMGSDAFWADYAAALAGKPIPSKVAEASAAKAGATIEPGTLAWLIAQYRRSAEFKRLDPQTQKTRTGIFESICREPIMPNSPVLFGAFPLDELTSKAVKVLRDRKAELPEAANNRLKALSSMVKWAIGEDHISFNPVRDVPRFRTGSDGHHTWTEEEIAQFAARHPLGTKAHLALALLCYTGQRGSDVCQLGRQHEKGDLLVFTQHKNRNRKPVRLNLPVLPALRRVLDASPVGEEAFLVSEYGRPFTIKGFGNWFRDRCDEAGLGHCSAHGLRKAAAVVAAEAGATPHQLMSIFGWATLEQPERYTKAARQKLLAGQSMHLLGAPDAGGVSNPKNQAEALDNSAEKR